MTRPLFARVNPLSIMGIKFDKEIEFPTKAIMRMTKAIWMSRSFEGQWVVCSIMTKNLTSYFSQK